MNKIPDEWLVLINCCQTDEQRLLVIQSILADGMREAAMIISTKQGHQSPLILVTEIMNRAYEIEGSCRG